MQEMPGNENLLP